LRTLQEIDLLFCIIDFCIIQQKMMNTEPTSIDLTMQYISQRIAILDELIALHDVSTFDSPMILDSTMTLDELSDLDYPMILHSPIILDELSDIDSPMTLDELYISRRG
jgi:hypothetical protein